MKVFFPEYLDQGSRGRAVALLQLMLLFAGLNPSIRITGKYDEETALGVMNLQRSLGFKGPGVDGNFGPATRKALAEQRGLDINKIPSDVFRKRTVAVNPQESS